MKVRSAKPEAKAYKLTDGEGMVLLVHPNGPNTGGYVIALAVKRRCWHWGNTPEVSLADAVARRDEARKL